MVEIVLINPAYTSQVGMEKFGERMKLNRHQAASYVIARRGQGFQDKLKKRIRKVILVGFLKPYIYRDLDLLTIGMVAICSRKAETMNIRIVRF